GKTRQIQRFVDPARARLAAQPPRVMEPTVSDPVPRAGVAGSGMLGRTAVDIAAAVRAGRIGATDVARAHLDYLAVVEPRLQASTRVLRRAALQDAARTDAHPDRNSLPLAGVPVAVTDVVDVVGYPASHGSRALPARPASADDPLVTALREAG